MRWLGACLSLALAAGAAQAAAQPERAPAQAGAESRPAPAPGADYLRAGLEQLAMLAGGTIWYWIDDRNIADWDFDSWEQRFREDAYRFDNNHFPINFIGHPLSGAAYYGLPRANRMDVLPSLGYAVLTTFIWEFVLEFQERFSINDFITTPLGGLAIGEGFIRLARYLDRAAHPALAWTLGLPVALHETMDGRAAGREGGAPDEPPGWARLSVRYGFGWALPGRDAEGSGFDVHRIAGSGTFVALDGYLEPGRSLDVFTDAEVAHLRMDALLSSTGAGFELWADTIVLGLHARDLTARPDGLLGASAIVGTNVSHLYRFEHFDGWHDRLSYTAFPGLASDVEAHLGAFRARVSGRFNFVFGASHAPDFPRWRELHPTQTPKTILQKHGYWYGWGYAGRLSLELATPRVVVGGSLAALHLDSQEGYDRLQHTVTSDIDGSSDLLEGAVWVRLTGLPLGLFAEASWRVQLRGDVLGDLARDRRLDRFELAVGTELY
ncbi:MAG: DUF3943 domain-containing protein [Sandaracinaceae bacterium]|nr:DUF3943 domain-containing protein [Sandaracinaceae bacterium]